MYDFLHGVEKLQFNLPRLCYYFCTETAMERSKSQQGTAGMCAKNMMFASAAPSAGAATVARTDASAMATATAGALSHASNRSECVQAHGFVHRGGSLEKSLTSQDCLR